MATQVTDAEVRPSRGRRRADRSAAPGGPPTTSRERWGRRAPLLPALIFMIIVTQLPFVVTLVISFMNWNALYRRPGASPASPTTGRSSPTRRCARRRSSRSCSPRSWCSSASCSGLGIALLLDRAFLGRGVVRTLMITPFLIVPVAAALVWKHALYNPNYGLFNGR